GRAFTAWIAQLIDRELSHPDADAREEAAELVALLTPVVKAFITDNSFETNNLALQVFGGHGYIEEWGMSQFVRDARINMIYEGTNGIQALDLVVREVLPDGGVRLSKFLGVVGQLPATLPAAAEAFARPLAQLVQDIAALSKEVGA